MNFAPCCGCGSNRGVFGRFRPTSHENTPMRKSDHQPTSPPPPEGPPPPPPYPSHQPESSTRYAVVADFERPQESSGRRFIKAFLVAFLIWFLTGAFVSSFLDLFGVRSVSAWFRRALAHFTVCNEISERHEGRHRHPSSRRW